MSEVNVDRRGAGGRELGHRVGGSRELWLTKDEAVFISCYASAICQVAYGGRQVRWEVFLSLGVHSP